MLLNLHHLQMKHQRGVALLYWLKKDMDYVVGILEIWMQHSFHLLQKQE